MTDYVVVEGHLLDETNEQVENETSAELSASTKTTQHTPEKKAEIRTEQNKRCKERTLFRAGAVLNAD